jgi:hypothetical protein
LLLNQQLGVTDNVDEKNVPDLQSLLGLFLVSQRRSSVSKSLLRSKQMT